LGNQELQLRDGAAAERLVVIPNGIDFEAMSAIPRDLAPRPPTVALIGRVVPIKDVKTYIRAIAILRRIDPSVVGLDLGPVEDDLVYVRECEQMVAHLGLGEALRFVGRVNVTEYLAP